MKGTPAEHQQSNGLEQQQQDNFALTASHDTTRQARHGTRNTEHGTRFPRFVDNILPTSDARERIRESAQENSQRTNSVHGKMCRMRLKSPFAGDRKTLKPQIELNEAETSSETCEQQGELAEVKERERERQRDTFGRNLQVVCTPVHMVQNVRPTLSARLRSKSCV